jgi:hypothetical protein
MQAVGETALPEVWYSLVRAKNADGEDFNASEANTEESREVRFPRVCRGPQGVACMERERQELERPHGLLEERASGLWYASRESYERGNPDPRYGET